MSIERPPQLQIDAKLDRCIDIALRRLMYGAGAGAVSAVLLFKRPSMRAASVAFGAGLGLGTAYTECQPELEKLFNVNLPK
jgi:inner membrane organizing system protein 1|mmetsp:Transcript_25157/g.42094  ORF Transcript_25157/g.42094 Transcript_25157/m.42094 type:complete len:81 (+) Transcript_25157:135-377(+)|eukprot:CAMPEP_0198210430 /NCGR_PEP_ID=MMETSP1445-20131203/20105_1 /TAXON_ID=36898 /ORGANISM="Pyramimonas sp., Strain CCMP2087" /LENGTH=80 /DNA_ID=CAMNT_0043884493 /DNA_START=111 /DNA_END=353 /DNA_ORIENTATION=+